MILHFLLRRLVTRWIPGQGEAVFLCKVWSSIEVWFSYNVYPNCDFWILQEMCFLVHHFLSFVLTFSDTCLLNFLNCSLTEQTCKKCSPASENIDRSAWQVWNHLLDSAIFTPLVWEPNDLYVRILKRFSNEVRQNKAKYSLPATK